MTRVIEIDYPKMVEILRRMMNDPNQPKGDIYLMAVREHIGDPTFEFKEGERQQFKQLFYVALYSNEIPYNPIDLLPSRGTLH